MAGESVIRRLDGPADVADKAAEHVAEQDFQSFSEALGSSARGRAFLAEYARRNRHADTEAVLAVLHRLEETAINKSASPEADRIRQDLRALLDTLRTARPQTENSPTAIKAATLAALIDFTQARIEAVVGMPEGLRDLEPVVAVPAPDQPELPIPHPSASASTGPVMALVQPQTAERPNIAVTNAAIVAPLTQARELTGIPIVEFDYRPQLAARPVQPQEPIDEAWTALAPPSIANPLEPAQAAAPVEVARAPEPAPFVPAEIAPQTTDPEPEPETYELWLDEPQAAAPVAATEPPAIAPEVVAPEVVAAEAVTAQIAETIEQQPAFVPANDFMVSVKAEAVQTPATMEAPAAAPAMTAIEALVQQMEKTAPPAKPVTAPAPIKGKAEAIDPLAPITALSEEERIALFS